MTFLSRRSIPVPLMLAGLLGATTRVEATCGGSTCYLVPRTQDGVVGHSQFRIDLSYRYVNQNRMRQGTGGTDLVLGHHFDFAAGEILLDRHEEIRTQNSQLEIDLAYGIAERLTLTGKIDLYTQRDHEHFGGLAQGQRHFSRQDGASGFGDVQIGARYALLLQPSHLLVAGVSLKLPTGVYRLLDSHGTINTPGLQPGTGSTDVVSSAFYLRGIGAGEVFASASYRVNTVNDLDYAFGNETHGTLGVSRRFRRLHASVQLNVRHAARDRLAGRAVPATGATMLSVSPGLRVEPTPSTAIYGHVQVPVRQDVNEAQLAPRAGLVVGISKAF